MKRWIKIVAGLVSISIAVSFSSCKKEDDQVELIPLENLLEMIDDETTLDEVMELQSIELSKNTSPKEESLADSVFKLESYLQILDEIENVNFTSNTNIVEDFNRDYNKLWVYETKYLIDLYNADDTTEEEKEKIGKELKQQELGYKRWISQNGINISYELLVHAIKTSICDELELLPQEYNYRIIKPENNNKENTLGTVKILEPKTNEVIAAYTVDESDDSISQAIRLLYSINDITTGDNAYYIIVQKSKEALEYTKILAVSNIKVTNDEIESTSSSKSKEKLLKYTKKYLKEENQDD